MPAFPVKFGFSFHTLGWKQLLSPVSNLLSLSLMLSPSSLLSPFKSSGFSAAPFPLHFGSSTPFLLLMSLSTTPSGAPAVVPTSRPLSQHPLLGPLNTLETAWLQT